MGGSGEHIAGGTAAGEGKQAAGAAAGAAGAVHVG